MLIFTFLCVQFSRFFLFLFFFFCTLFYRIRIIFLTNLFDALMGFSRVLPLKLIEDLMINYSGKSTPHYSEL